MNNKYLIPVLFVVGLLVWLAGGSLAYWSWSSTNAQKTNVTFTVGSNFSCGADGGGNITNTNYFVPTDCTNSTYALKRTIKVSTTQQSGDTIYLNMNLKVNSIGSGLASSQNFKYALTTKSTSCESGVLAEGNFNGVQANEEIPLLINERYLTTTNGDTFYLWIWLDKEETSSSTQNQSVNLTITGNCTNQEPSKTYAPWGAEVDTYTRINFVVTSSNTNGKGLYVLKTTQKDVNPIYYYRGAVDNNNVYFGGFCWKIVRSTDTGGTKLIYNGLSTGDTNYECNNTGTDSQLSSKSIFGASVDYMYGARYSSKRRTSEHFSISYKYGNSFIYDGINYHLVDVIDSIGTWENDYNTLNNNHYTCFNTTGTCSSIYYIYYTSSSNAYYITLTNGKSVEQALDEMLTSSSNTSSSTIKSVIDNWYTTNLLSEEANLEDTVWCNDREIYQLNGWDPNGGDTTKYLYFKPYERAEVLFYPRLTCKNINDSFTKNSANGNGKLSNPIGLLTSDEVMLAGGRSRLSNNTFYLYTNQIIWLGSPYSFEDGSAYVWSVSSGVLNGDFYANYNNFGVRPSVSIKSGGTWSGSGTSSDPYTVSFN